VFHSGSLFVLPTNIRLEWKSIQVASTLAHYDTAIITAIKSFIVQALDEKSFLLKCDKNETNAFSQGMSWNSRPKAEITHGIIEIVVHLCVYAIDNESLQNRLLKVVL